ncbi:MAG: PIN domain-containing protein [Nitrococcus sp.]|nr:PIN domain-containing protein [Nitrococcus sp.]
MPGIGMRIFLDANVLFSAARTDGPVRELLYRLQQAKHPLCMDEYVVEEARRNLEAKSSGHEETLQTLLRNIEVSPCLRDSLDSVIAQHLPKKDHPVLSAAIRLHCEALVTGDRRHVDICTTRASRALPCTHLRHLPSCYRYEKARAGEHPLLAGEVCAKCGRRPAEVLLQPGLRLQISHKLLMMMHKLMYQILDIVS